MRITTTIAAAAIVILAAMPVMAQQSTSGYTRSNGTYVQPYVHTPPNGNPYDNYSTRGNTNPYTGAPGTHNPTTPTDPYNPFARR